MAERPRDRQRQARMMRIINVPMRLALNLPFPTRLNRQLMLIWHTGRKTGKRYRQPLSYVRDGDTLLTPGGGRWTLNLTDGVAVPMRLRGKKVMARPELIGDPDTVDRLLAVMAANNPRIDSFVRIPRRPDGHLEPELLRTAIRHGLRVVRWHLDDGSRS